MRKYVRPLLSSPEKIQRKKMHRSVCDKMNYLLTLPVTASGFLCSIGLSDIAAGGGDGALSLLSLLLSAPFDSSMAAPPPLAPRPCSKSTSSSLFSFIFFQRLEKNKNKRTLQRRLLIGPRVVAFFPCHGLNTAQQVLLLIKPLRRRDDRERESMRSCCGGGGVARHSLISSCQISAFISLFFIHGFP